MLCRRRVFGDCLRQPHLGVGWKVRRPLPSIAVLCRPLPSFDLDRRAFGSRPYIRLRRAAWCLWQRLTARSQRCRKIPKMVRLVPRCLQESFSPQEERTANLGRSPVMQESGKSLVLNTSNGQRVVQLQSNKTFGFLKAVYLIPVQSMEERRLLWRSECAASFDSIETI